MFVSSEISYHLEQNEKKLFSVSGKLAIFSDLSSNLGGARPAAGVESTRKSEQILTCIKIHLAAKIRLFWI